ncbi:hypothetical protein [Paludisphaera mucosa]|uniref:Uncharacterized protein n=1 Tax=Paludisphaera mucosa TaxID=3030827 RepID=A0ABT6F5Y7_9BACT|nr:hypothetical protein [Paludisphaera mucosa]MDG3002824.1 hypothetical protein [Paludisphaera mucosa]
MKLAGREYKTMIDHAAFVDPRAAADLFWTELEEAAETPTRRLKGRFDREEGRRVSFLDTPDLSLRRSNLVLRRRAGEGGDQYTLKCRSEDRYEAAGTDVDAAPGLDGKSKLEEDIAPPFLCRFSHSCNAKLPGDPPATLGDAAALFPLLGRLVHDGRPLALDLPLRTVHDVVASERVLTGAKLVFDPPGEPAVEASAAMIVWSNPKTARILLAEFSFRIKADDERFGFAVAASARSFFEVVLGHDWARPDSRSKTEYVFRDTRGD